MLRRVETGLACKGLQTHRGLCPNGDAIDKEVESPQLHDGVKNLVAGVGLQLAEVTQVPVVHCGGDHGPPLPTYHAICEGEDIQGIGTLLPATQRQRQTKREGERGMSEKPADC